MSITHLLNKSATVQRMSDLGADRMALSTVTSVLRVHIQPESTEKRPLDEGVFGKRYRIFTDVSFVVSEGDRLRDTDGNYYTVVSGGVSRRTFNSIDYQLIMAEKTK